MVPTGHPAPFEDSQAVPTSNFMRSNSGLLSGSQGAFPSPRNQLGNMNMLGNMSNVSSLLQQAGAVSGISGSRSAQLVVMDNGVESNPLSAVGNGMGCNVPSASFVSSSQKAKANAMATAKFQGQQISSLNMNHMLTDLQTNSQIDPNYFQHFQQSMNQFNATSNPQHQLPQQVQRGQLMRAGLGAVGMVKQEPQMTNDQLPQQSQAVIQSPGAVKLEPQQLPSMRSLPPPVKTEPQNSDPSLFSPHQQQQQQSTPAQLLHQQRLAQIQQQQQITKAIPQQRVPVQQQFQAQNLHTRSPIKPNYEPGTCAHRLTHYMYKQQHRPEDNNIEYWRNFVAEFFSPNAKKKWCVSLYGSGRQTTEVFPQDIWHCEICKRKPGRGFGIIMSLQIMATTHLPPLIVKGPSSVKWPYIKINEATVEVLPRLFKLKYESGTIEELLYVDMPNEYQNSSGQIVLDYAKAIQQSVFEQLRVVRDGQLRLVFSQDLKICSWEFCARRHEEFIPRRLLIPQVNQLGTAAQKYQAAVQCAPTNISVSELQNNCNMFIAPVRQLAKTLDVPMVNDFGYSKRFIRCLQISEVVNSMTDLIDFGRESGTGPMESLAKFPRITGSFSGFINGQPPPKSEDQQNGDDCVQAQVSSSNGLSNVNNTMNRSTVNRLVYQNSMNPRHQNSSRTSQYIGSSNSQLPSPSSSTTTLPQTQQTIPSPIPSPLPAVSSDSLDAVNESKGSVQKIIQDMMMTSSQLGGGSGGGIMCLNDLKPPTNNNVRIGNGGFGGLGFGNGIRGGLPNTNNNNNNNSSLTTMNGRIGMTVPREQSMMNQQHEPINGLLGSVNGFNNLPFDWKPSP